MSVFLKRGTWWGRKDSGQTKRFKTEAEAYEFTGEKPPKAEKPKKVVKPTLGVKNASKEKDSPKVSKEKADTYEQETILFGKSYGKKKI